VISDSKSGIVQLKTAVTELKKEVEGINHIIETPRVKTHQKHKSNLAKQAEMAKINKEDHETSIFG